MSISRLCVYNIVELTHNSGNNDNSNMERKDKIRPLIDHLSYKYSITYIVYSIYPINIVYLFNQTQTSFQSFCIACRIYLADYIYITVVSFKVVAPNRYSNLVGKIAGNNGLCDVL